MEQFYRLVGFILVPSLSILSSAVLLPLVSSKFGPSGWTALTVGQSAGAIASIVVGLSWPFLGGYQVAVSVNHQNRSDIYVRSVLSRGLVLGILIPLLYAFCAAFGGRDGEASGLFAVGTALNGMTAGWYWAGSGRPLPLILSEGIVRLGGYSAAIVGFGLFHFGLPWYAFCVLCSLLVGLLSNSLSVRAIYGPLRVRHALPYVVSDIRSQLPGTISRVVLGVASFGGPVIFSMAIPQALVLFAAFDQVQKSFSNAASAVTSGFVSWVGGGDGHRRRARIALVICGAGSLSFALGLSLFGQLVFGYLFDDVIEVSSLDVTVVGLVVSAIFMVRSIELLAVVPMQLEKHVYRANVWTSVLSLAAMFILGPTLGAIGGELSLGLAALAAISYYSRASRRPVAVIRA